MKKKGFTLIELLAVLVILAILALITIPIVLSIIKNARENSYKRSIESYGRSVENAVMEYKMNHTDLSDNINDYEIKTSGNNVKCDDTIQGINSENGITLINCYVEDKDNNPKSKKYKYHNGILTEGEIFKEYKVGDLISVANEKYYVITYSGESQDYVVALKENPLTVNEVNTYGGVGTENNHVNKNVFSSVGTSKNIKGDGSIGGMAYYSSPTCGWVNSHILRTDCTSNYDESDIKYVIDNWALAKFKSSELKIVDDYKARLIKFNELHALGYGEPLKTGSNDDFYQKSDRTPAWVYGNYDYRTMSSYKDSIILVWRVTNNGSLVNLDIISEEQAVRPVINVYKSAIQ